MSSNHSVIFSVVPGSTEPIYRQIIAQTRRLIAGGQLAAGDALPSVREVAEALAVNPMTVSKAYSLLEGEGLLARRRGVGMVVADVHTKPSSVAERSDLIRPALQRVADEARQLELSPDHVISLFSKILRGRS